MKYIILTIQILILVNITYGQSVRQINVHLVKESSQIDSLIDKFIPAAIKNRSCFIFHVRKPNKYLYRVDCKKTNLLLIDQDILNTTENLTFFNYKGYIIFVVGVLAPNNFFVKTGYSKTFKFKNYPKKNDISEVLQNVINGGDFIYEDGKFKELIFAKG